MPDGALPLLSVCMIVKDEEPVLGRALASASALGPDVEIVVVDTGSTDRTADIAAQAGARVVSFPWIADFSAARNFGFAQARGAWLLVLDADEEVTAELASRVREVLARTRADGIRVPVRNVDDAGRVLTCASSTRIVRSGRGHAYENRVHEDIEAPILRAGGTLEDADLPFVHHGYTAGESARKGRHARNLALVRAAHEAAPHEPRHAHYLGLQLAIGGEHEDAAPFFERMLAEHPRHPLAGWSASQLGAIRLASRANGSAWRAFELGSKAALGRVTCLLQLGAIALREGDGLSALGYADALDALDARPSVEGDVARRREGALVLRAEALAVGGEPEQGLALLRRGVGEHPADGPIGDAYVRIAERIHGARRGVVVAVTEASASPSVLAGAISAFVRVRAWREAVALGEQHGVANEARAHALFRVGRHEDAARMIASFGESAAVHALLFALETDDETAVMRALDAMPPACGRAAARVRAGLAVEPRDGWIVTGWLEVAVLCRADALASRLAACLPEAPSAREALHALLVHDAGEPMRALGMALPYASSPDAMEVVGLVAMGRGDARAGATLLSARARIGESAVRVYATAATALVELGRIDEARDVVERGCVARPASRTLGEMRSLLAQQAAARAPPLAQTGT
jgi:tetratricopeptide (TPR) repeat protein